MKYFYHRNQSGALNVDQFMNVIEEPDNNQVYVIDDSAQGAAKFILLRGKAPMTALLSNSNFQLSDDKPDTQIFFSVDDKGKVTTYNDYPEWSRTQKELEQLRLVTLYGLENLSFMEGMKKLSTLPADAIDSIMGGVLSKLHITTQTSQVARQATDKKPRIQNLSAEQFKEFIKLMTAAVKDKKLPSMGYFVDHGVTDPDLKRGYRTYYKLLAGHNMKPDRFQPADDYFEDLSKRLDAVKNEGIERAYNFISTNISKFDPELPISSLDYVFSS